MKPLLIFILTVSCARAEADQGRLCLALVGFSESIGEPDTGVAEAMYVVLERLKFPQMGWGDSICDVVNKKGQFVGVENFKYPRRPEAIDAKEWQRDLDMADKVIAGTAPRDPKCKGATHFDQGGNKEGLVKLCRIGGHTFYIEKTNVEMARK